MAETLTERVSTLESVIRLYRFMHDRLRYIQPGVLPLINAAAASKEFQRLRFLKECRDQVENGEDFDINWKIAVKNDSAALGKEAASVVASLSDVLGKTDLESQLAAINYGAELLEQRLLSAREYAARHQRLYRTLGVLAGVLVVVLII